ncbi:MAG: TIR domain-containing protein [Anaerolineaceae bacterium]|nr:MAG: TIR domain-containing protein [Anaerolineaceae bacterium]
MGTGHCFISYSNADGLDFATKLADELEGRHPFIDVWFEKREMSASGDDWDDQLAAAIQTCKCFLFVMSVDSTAKLSNCKEEWTWALKCKKPVICLLLDNKAEDQFRLNSRQKIDFTSNFEAGIAQLRLAIAHLDSPQGLLDQLKHRLADANRDFRRASDEEKLRIKAELDELTEQINRQEEIVRNPKAAEEKTEKNIQSGLERERQPEKPTTKSQSTKFINPPPGIAPNYYQDRQVETKQVVDFLNNDAQRLMTIAGRAGVGKTAMVCRLLKALERGELPDDLGEMKADGIVYLSETGSHRVNFANVFADLSKLLPKDDAERLEGIYKNPQTSTGDKMRALLDAFPSGRVILLLDNFETLIDAESLSLRDSELSDALNALLGGQHHAVKVVITTRIAPRDLAISEPGRQHHLSLDDGLESPYAENVLREMDADGRVGLKTAPDALLKVAREMTRGYPRALEALYAILSVDRYTTLEELLELSLPDEVVQKLVGEAFNRLDPSAQKVMQALAVYNRPVSPAAIDYLLQPHLPSIDSALVLHRLVNMHFARRDAGKYYLHSADSEYALSTIPEGFADDKLRTSKGVELLNYYFKTLNKYPDFLKVATKPKSKQTKEAFQEIAKKENINMLQDLAKSMQNLDPVLLQKMQDTNNFKDEAFLAELNQSLQVPQVWTRYALTFRAADFFAQARKPRAEWKKLDDLTAQLAEFDLRCAAGDYDTAASVLFEFSEEYLFLWGHYRLMIELHEKLQKKITDKKLEMFNWSILGSANAYIGKVQDAILYQERSLSFARETKDRMSEEVILSNLGNRYATLGNLHKAITFYEQALLICQEFGYRQGEGATLCNLGNRYLDLGEVYKAIKFYEQSLVIRREIGDRDGEARDLANTAEALNCLENYQEAKETCLLAIQIADKISSADLQNYARWGLAQAYLFQNDLPNARVTIEAALQYDVPQNSHNTSALHGIIALRQGERETAQEAFTKSIAQADEILAKTPDYYSALDAKGLALCGLILTGRGAVPAPNDAPTNDTGRGDPAPTVNDAIATFRKARKIAPHAGVVKSVLRLFDELAKCDTEGILKDVRAAAEGIT